MAEYLITVALTEHGRPEVAEENAERFLDAFVATHSEAGPAVGANLARGWLEVTFSVEAADANEAFELGKPIFSDGAAECGLEPTPIARIEVEAVPVDRSEPDLVPA